MSDNYVLKLFNASKNQQWEEVESLANKFLKSDPNNVYLHLKLGQAAEKQNRVLDAIHHYESCFAIEKQDLDPDYSYQKTFLKKLDILYQREKMFEESFAVCQWYVERYPYEWDSWNRLKRAAWKVGDLKLSEHAAWKAGEIKLSERAKTMSIERCGEKFRPSGEMPSKSPIDEENITEEDIEGALARFDRWARKNAPWAVGLLDAEVEEELQTTPTNFFGLISSPFTPPRAIQG